MKLNKILKIIMGGVIFLTLPSLLFIGFVYFKYNEDLPIGKQGIQADALANKIFDALDYEAYKATNYIEWTYKNRHHYKWRKNEATCEVYWKNHKVQLNLNDQPLSIAYVDNIKVKGEKAEELIATAQEYFNSDSFWLIAPYKLFEAGTERRLVTLDNGKKALLATYKTNGLAPDGSYLWILDDAGKPRKFKMWVDTFPIGGLESSWTDWITTESGAQLPTFHEMLFSGIIMGEVIGTK